MNDKLRNYIDQLFAEAPQSLRTVELKEEILQNVTDKYNDLLSQGKTEEAAFNIAAASIGDVSGLINDLNGGAPNAQPATPQEQQRSAQRSATLVSTAIALYIFGIVPVILIKSAWGPGLMFVFFAAATALLIYNGMTKVKYVKSEDTVVENFKEWKHHNSAGQRAFRSVSLAVWAFTTALYFLISFTMGAWYITWVIFIIALAVNAIIKAVFDLRR